MTNRREPSLFLIGVASGGTFVLGLVLLFMVASCAPKPDLSKCYRQPTEAEFFCDDCPEADPKRCGLEGTAKP